jgi:N-carbamoylputrescine amidase
MVKVAAIQMYMGDNKESNTNKAEFFVRHAAAKGANIILLPELFQGRYFCKDKDEKYFEWATELEGNELINRFSDIAEELGVVLLVSYFEKSVEVRGEVEYFNSLVLIDADGTVGENYRKTHIPDGPGYEEKFYFKPGDTGFKVWHTKFGRVGAGICWDQWFSESARLIALKGADIMFFPTAIGSEPETGLDSKEHWQRVQMGHAASNTVPVVAANRVGVEDGESCSLTFYGSSFITDYTGKKIAEASRDKEQIIYGDFDFEQNRKQRIYWGLLRDRQPNSYGDLLL